MAARTIVVGNEKGGAGKSTLAIHIATGLMHAGASVAVIDLDVRQRSMGRFFENRHTWLSRNGENAPEPLVVDPGAAGVVSLDAVQRFNEAFDTARGQVDYLLIDTPGGDTPLSRAAHGKADQIVTPMNDSFVDFDMLGQVDPVTLDLLKPSVYAEAVWDARKAKAIAERGSIDWVVLRNRLAPTEAKNRRRLDERVEALAKRVGFRNGPGLRDRVIYRELFPFGLTVADLSPSIRPVAMSLSHVAARQELRSLMQCLGLEEALDQAA